MINTIFFMLAGILVFAGIVLWLLFRFHHTSHQLNVEKYRRKWLEIEQLLSKDDERNRQFAVIEADKLLDIAMKESGIRGDTMGECLKTAKERWSNQNAVWSSHKLRNQIVHEADVQVSFETARRALPGLKQA